MTETTQLKLGRHFMLDCYGCSKEKLSDLETINAFLSDLPKKLDLTRQHQPEIFQYHGADSDEWGVTGVVRLADAHICIHTFPDNDHAFIDIFSCQEYSHNSARQEALKFFEAAHHEEQIVNHSDSELEPDIRTLAGSCVIN